MTQDDLAARINTTKRVIGSYERGETSIPLEAAYEITEVLGCTLDELCGRRIERSFTDPLQEAVNESFENMNAKGRETLVSVARSLEKDTANRIEKDGAEHAAHKAAVGA